MDSFIDQGAHVEAVLSGDKSMMLFGVLESNLLGRRIGRRASAKAKRTLREGLAQTRAYLDRCTVAEGHLVLFDRSEDASWDNKVYRREATEGGAVVVWGM